jgi:hypothetical protein
MKRSYLIIFSALILVVAAQGQDKKEVMAQIQANLVTSMKSLRAYEWVETVTVYKGGEQKSQTQSRCLYGADGKVSKTVISKAADQGKSPKGVRGKVASNKKEEVSDYIEKSVGKVHQYLPPKSEKLQAIYAAGKTSVEMIEPNKKLKLKFPDYLLAGDLVSIAADVEKKVLNSISVNSYIDKPENKIAFTLKYSLLSDGTSFPEETVLDMPSKEMKMVIKNAGYKKLENKN